MTTKSPPHPTDQDAPIEVEVIEIDGEIPRPPVVAAGTAGLRRLDPWDEARPAGESGTRRFQATWQGWPVRTRTLHPLWWPLLLIAGAMLVFLVLTLGLLLAVGIGVFRLIRALLRALLG